MIFISFGGKMMFQYWVYLIVAVAAIPFMFHYDKTHAEEISKRRNKKGKPVKPFHKRWWTWALIVIVIVGSLSSISGDTDDDDSSSDETTEQTSQQSKSSPKKASNSSKSKKDSSDSDNTNTVSKSDKIAAALTILKKSYKGIAKVTYDSDDDMFMIIPTGNDFKSELLNLISGGESVDDGWSDVTKSIDTISKSLYKNVGLKKTSVSLANPDDTSKVLYTSWNGSKVYDFMDDNN